MPHALSTFLATSALLASLLAAPLCQASPLSERLGYGPDAKVLILHADDLGSIASADRAYADLREHGFVTAGSIMFPCPMANEAVDYARAHPESDEGVHITLNSEWKNYRWGPATPVGEVPSLVDRFGHLADSLFTLFVWGRQRDAAREMETQIRLALDSGFGPSHIDTHMGGVFMRPSWLKAYLNLGLKYHLAPMLPKWSPDLKKHYGFLEGNAMAVFASGLLEQADRNGFLLLDYLIDQPYPKENTFASRKQAYIDLIHNLKPGVTQIMFHPAYADADFKQKIMSSNPEAILREWETEIMQDPDLKAELDRQHVQLIGWKKIQAAYDWSQVQEMR